MPQLPRFIALQFHAMLVVVVATASAGCEGCKKGAGAVKALVDKPPREEVEKQTIDALRTAGHIASELCGFPSAGLTDVQVEVKSQLLSNSEVRVRGKPLPFTGGTGGDAGAKPAGSAKPASSEKPASTNGAGAKGELANDAGGMDVPRAVVCTGTVMVAMRGEFTDDLQGQKDWRLIEGDSALEVKAIETPGVKYDEARHRPPSGGGGGGHH